MKTLATILLVVGLLQGAPAATQSVPAQAAAASPLLGRWSLDVSRLEAGGPKSVTIAFGNAPDGKWTMSVDILGADGSLRHTTGSYTLDGSPSHALGDTAEADIGAMKLPAPNTLVLGLTKHGVPASTRIYAVAPDGKSMTETASYFGRDNLPVLKTSYFTRMR